MYGLIAEASQESSSWWPVAMNLLVTAGVVTLIASLWARIMDYLRTKISESKVVENVALDNLLDKFAYQIVDIIDAWGREQIEKYGNKVSSSDKLASGVTKMQEWAEDVGEPLSADEAMDYIEAAHAAKEQLEKAVNFPGPVSSPSEPESDPTE